MGVPYAHATQVYELFLRNSAYCDDHAGFGEDIARYLSVSRLNYDVLKSCKFVFSVLFYAFCLYK